MPTITDTRAFDLKIGDTIDLAGVEFELIKIETYGSTSLITLDFNSPGWSRKVAEMQIDCRTTTIFRLFTPTN